MHQGFQVAGAFASLRFRNLVGDEFFESRSLDCAKNADRYRKLRIVDSAERIRIGVIVDAFVMHDDVRVADVRAICHGKPGRRAS